MKLLAVSMILVAVLGQDRWGGDYAIPGVQPRKERKRAVKWFSKLRKGRKSQEVVIRASDNEPGFVLHENDIDADVKRRIAAEANLEKITDRNTKFNTGGEGGLRVRYHIAKQKLEDPFERVVNVPDETEVPATERKPRVRFASRQAKRFVDGVTSQVARSRPALPLPEDGTWGPYS